MSSVFHGITAGRAFGKPGPFIGSAAAAPASTLLTGLVSWWKLDEESGTRADAVGTNHHTDNNTVGYASGKIGNAANFVAANSESLTLGIAGVIPFGTEDFSVSFWLKPAGFD